ncbi:40S ribosomal protein S4 [Galemys pyrenaicus]|uniref:40S ribosomal protein S4 n=1 Tax=Galemys pyrenaicus TaxID=202257 RepID=A0A8J6ATM6_GALPY|nr:40S ribosomal protein S4 [Galemys pyrenaicus]
MDVTSTDKTGENFYLIYDTKCHFAAHHITPEEAKCKSCKVRKIFVGTKRIVHLVSHDALAPATCSPHQRIATCSPVPSPVVIGTLQKCLVLTGWDFMIGHCTGALPTMLIPILPLGVDNATSLGPKDLFEIT